MVEQAEFLEHHPDAAAKDGMVRRRQGGDVLAEQVDQPLGWPGGQIDQLEQGALAGPRGAGEEMERAGGQGEGEVLEGLGRPAIAHRHVVEAKGVGQDRAGGLRGSGHGDRKRDL